MPIWKHWTGSNKALSVEERQGTLAAASTASSKKLEWWCYRRYLSWLQEGSLKRSQESEFRIQNSGAVLILDFIQKTVRTTDRQWRFQLLYLAVSRIFIPMLTPGSWLLNS
ncbi:hypothetical protein G7B40_008235 [Aetokthonos hydrillicola Thurmond2011]|uniref:Uncharacterized protein n=1 Tax=Aetokthonos hydrillicola Thurmond2011 TaxID=2712845 RepID=A0AAP5M6Y5_9CYAN|nr:hypothetical protein [Aetokthonos hydrillicola CCALA 1050]MDR9894560.1 hypothetical protein [Aetokthonos hydrillicola Thurmond2011]